MSAIVRFTGLDELLKQLTDAPKAVRSEGIAIVKEETEGCASEYASGLPVASGTLASRVKTSYPSSDLLVGIVQNTAPHSHLYEFGTKGPRTGPNGENRGVMPAANRLVPIAQRRRQRMFLRLREMLERHGFTLSEG